MMNVTNEIRPYPYNNDEHQGKQKYYSSSQHIDLPSPAATQSINHNLAFFVREMQTLTKGISKGTHRYRSDRSRPTSVGGSFLLMTRRYKTSIIGDEYLSSIGS